jgi:general stress protein YciG
MNPIESGRKGGTATRDKYPSLCPLCGSLIKSAFYSEVGHAGGEATLKRYGREHFVEMGKRGGRPRSCLA